MKDLILKNLAQVDLSNTITSVYTVPINKTTIISEILLYNSGSTDAIVKIYFVKSGDTTESKNLVYPSISIKSIETKSIISNTILETGSQIHIGLTENLTNVACNISGTEIL